MKWIAIFAFAAMAVAQENFIITSDGEMGKVFFEGKAFEFEGKIVTGAPYSAQAVTQTTQILADGNRITRQSSSLIARDSQGRTRREQNLSVVGPWTSPGGKGLVFISDPVAGTRYTLEANSKTAVKMPLNAASHLDAQKMEARLKEARAKETAERAALGAITSEPKNTSTTESLGTQTIGGVVADGKRVTETIPAGKIGNEKAIAVVNEIWYSSDLQTVVMSKHSDPRSGDVVYTLNNISRAEPDPSMFAVPQDFKVTEANLKGREVREVRE